MEYKKQNGDKPRSGLIALEKAVLAGSGEVAGWGRRVTAAKERRCPDQHRAWKEVLDCYIVHGN